ncbi:MAG: hypothetical protein OEM97_05575 [Acidimicrobiia bacterium]|nr:hypothetical protein [Acidimicrobiia bacterium]
MTAIPAVDPASGLNQINVDSIGPKVGERFPDLTLPDQLGTVVDLHEQRGARRAIVVFHRSADW